jgi:ERCC4-type nuclease
MIICDTREFQSGIPHELKRANVEIIDAVMPLGDYRIIPEDDLTDYLETHITSINLYSSNEEYIQAAKEEFAFNIDDLYTLLIETKRDKDFPGSIRTRHMNDQLWRQSRDCWASVLMIEGTLADACAGTGITERQARMSIDSAIMKRALEGRQGSISVITTASRQETIEHLINFNNYVNGQKSVVRQDKSLREISKKNNLERAIRATLATLPGVDDTLAQRMLNEFHSIREIVNSTDADLETIAGFGPKNTKKIIDYLDYKVGIK